VKPAGKIRELATNSNNKNIRDLYRRVNEFKYRYQPKNNFVKDEYGDLLADSHNILKREKNYCLSYYMCIVSVMLQINISGPLDCSP
jgi:hypothetical protein